MVIRGRSRRQRGSIFILAVWILGLLAVFAASVGISVRMTIDAVRRLEVREQLYGAAEAGVYRAVQELMLSARQSALRDTPESLRATYGDIPWDSMLVSVGSMHRAADFMPAGGPETKFWGAGPQDEAGKININTAPVDRLRELLVWAGGKDRTAAQRIAEAIADWRDTDEQPLSQGAESSYYQRLPVPYVCKNAQFSAVEELRLVREVDAELMSCLQPYVTIYGGGSVNLNCAAVPVLAALQFGETLIEKIIRFRCGPDGQWLTEDDRHFSSTAAIVAELSQVAALTPEEAAVLSTAVAANAVGVGSAYFGVESTAVQPERGAACRIQSVFERRTDADGQPKMVLKQWRTMFFREHDDSRALRGGAGIGGL